MNWIIFRFVRWSYIGRKYYQDKTRLAVLLGKSLFPRTRTEKRYNFFQNQNGKKVQLFPEPERKKGTTFSQNLDQISRDLIWRLRYSPCFVYHSLGERRKEFRIECNSHRRDFACPCDLMMEQRFGNLIFIEIHHALKFYIALICYSTIQ